MGKKHVHLFYDHGKRSRILCQNMEKGIHSAGDKVDSSGAVTYMGKPISDVAVFYGLRGKLMQILKTYVDAGKTAVLIDLGFWGRHDGGRLAGYHKFVINGLQPGDYFNSKEHPANRFNKFGIDLKPYNPEGEYILLAGMSGKAASVYGLAPEQYERNMVREIRKYTDMPIVYRPKPTFQDATKIDGAIYSGPEEDLNGVLEKAKIVVSHHSNVAVDAIVAGKPVIVGAQCVASCFSNNVGEGFLGNVFFPTDSARLQWLYNIAYTQWNVREMRTGVAWNFFKSENLV